jgi:hypothetical protein
MHLSSIGLAESLNVVSENSECFGCSQNEIFKTVHSVLSQNAGYHQLLNISRVFDIESPTDQCIEHLTLTDILKIKYAAIVACELSVLRILENTCWH